MFNFFENLVGATQFTSNNGQISEFACSILTGALITGGGGFSSFQPMQSYQTQAVQSYLNNNANSLPPSYSVSQKKI